MKNHLILGFLVIYFLCAQLDVQAKPKPADNKAKPCLSLDKEISSIMNYSDFNSDEKIQGAVVMKYFIDENDKLNIIEMQSNDQRLKDYVYAKLNGKAVCNLSTDNSSKLLKISFRIR